MSLNVSVFYPSVSFNDLETGSMNFNCLKPFFDFKNLPPLGETKYDEFIRLVEDPTDRVIYAWYGGNVENKGRTSKDLVDCMKEEDYKTIKDSKKKIVGLSDVSYLLSYLLAHEIPCFYGPNLCSGFIQCSEIERKIMFKYLYRALYDDNYSIDFLSNELCPNGETPWSFNGGVVAGRISGGNLFTIGHIDNFSNSGIREDDILFIEDIDPLYVHPNVKKSKSYEYLQKILSKMPKIKGLIIGKSKMPKAFDTEKNIIMDYISNTQEKEYLEELLKTLNLPDIPIVANIACGHAHPSVTLPLGRQVILNAYECKMSII